MTNFPGRSDWSWRPAQPTSRTRRRVTLPANEDGVYCRIEERNLGECELEAGLEEEAGSNEQGNRHSIPPHYSRGIHSECCHLQNTE